MVDVAYPHVVSRLLEVLPEIRDDYELEVANWGPEGPHAHIVFGSVFSQFVARLEAAVSNTDDDDEPREILNRAFDLVEELALSSDFETRCIVEASVLESLLGDANGWDRYSKHFQRNTAQMARKVMDRFSGK